MATSGLASLAGFRPARAADAPWAAAAAAPSPTPAAMSAELVTTGLYLIRGGGANTLLRFSANGLLLVDAKEPGNYRALMSQVHKVSKLLDMPVRALVLTGPSDDAAGNAAQFAAAHVQVVAQQHALQRIAALRDVVTPSMLPAFGYDREHRLQFGGIEVLLRHAGPARTDGDTVAVFADLKVAAIGRLVDIDPPHADEANGGSLAGWAAALDDLLTLDCRRYVPSRGPVLARSDVVAYRSKLQAPLQAR